jgi:hypothetical protein
MTDAIIEAAGRALYDTDGWDQDPQTEGGVRVICEQGQDIWFWLFCLLEIGIVFGAIPWRPHP